MFGPSLGGALDGIPLIKPHEDRVSVVYMIVSAEFSTLVTW